MIFYNFQLINKKQTHMNMLALSKYMFCPPKGMFSSDAKKLSREEIAGKLIKIRTETYIVLFIHNTKVLSLFQTKSRHGTMCLLLCDKNLIWSAVLTTCYFYTIKKTPRKEVSNTL